MAKRKPKKEKKAPPNLIQVLPTQPMIQSFIVHAPADTKFELFDARQLAGLPERGDEITVKVQSVAIEDMPSEDGQQRVRVRVLYREKMGRPLPGLEVTVTDNDDTTPT